MLQMGFSFPYQPERTRAFVFQRETLSPLVALGLFSAFVYIPKALDLATLKSPQLCHFCKQEDTFAERIMFT